MATSSDSPSSNSSTHQHPHLAAKQLRAAVRRADPEAIARVRHVFLDTTDRSDDDLAAHTNLQRCQHVIAKECGAEHWVALTQAAAPALTGSDPMNVAIHLVRPTGDAWVRIGTSLEGGTPVLLPASAIHTLAIGMQGVGKTHLARQRSEAIRLPIPGTWPGAAIIWIPSDISYDERRTKRQAQDLVDQAFPLEAAGFGPSIILTTPSMIAKRRQQHPNATVVLYDPTRINGEAPPIADVVKPGSLVIIDLAGPDRAKGLAEDVPELLEILLDDVSALRGFPRQVIADGNRAVQMMVRCRNLVKHMRRARHHWMGFDFIAWNGEDMPEPVSALIHARFGMATHDMSQLPARPKTRSRKKQQEAMPDSIVPGMKLDEYLSTVAQFQHGVALVADIARGRATVHLANTMPLELAPSKA